MDQDKTRREKEAIEKTRDVQTKHEAEIKKMNDDKRSTQGRHDQDMKQLRTDMQNMQKRHD